MSKRIVCCIAIGAFAAFAVAADGVVKPILNMPTEADPDTPIAWSITVEVTGTNQGLALIAADLVQDPANTTLIDIPLATTIPTEMAGFDRPGGITNPGEGAPSGYVGVQRGTTGEMNLVQIGGAQNTFGQAGTEFGLDTDVDTGIGQGGAQLIVSGSLPGLPEGTYTFSLQNVLANVLDADQGDYWSVVAATIDDSMASVTIEVASSGILGDLNCDGVVDFGDINPFVAALGGQSSYESQYPGCNWWLADANQDGAVDFDDINPFVAILSGGK